jgi:hypothetical protein
VRLLHNGALKVEYGLDSLGSTYRARLLEAPRTCYDSLRTCRGDRQPAASQHSPLLRRSPSPQNYPTARNTRRSRSRSRESRLLTIAKRKRVGSSGETRDARTGITRRRFCFREQSRLTFSKQRFCVRRGTRRRRHGPRRGFGARSRRRASPLDATGRPRSNARRSRVTRAPPSPRQQNERPP